MVVLFSEVLNVWNYRAIGKIIFLLERSNIQCPFLGGSAIRGSTIDFILNYDVDYMRL